MTTKKLVFLGTIAFLLLTKSSVILSQENYEPGYIIDLNGNKLNGYIDYRNWEKTPEKIYFKEDMNSIKTSKTAGEIKEFGVSNEIYVSAIVEAEVSTLNLEYNPEFITEFDTTFLQTMILGPKSLYYYRSIYGKEQFYIKKDNDYELLVYKKYLKKEKIRLEEITSSVENKKYLGQLNNYLNNCQDISSKLEDTKYFKESLEKLFLFYYSCSKSDIDFQRKTEKISIEKGVFGGLTLTNLKFNPFVLDYFEKSQYTTSKDVSAGFFVDFVFPRNRQMLSIHTELLYTSFTIYGTLKEFVNASSYENTDMTLSYSYLKMNNMFRLKYPVGSMFIFANIGMSNGYAISEINYKKVEKMLYTSHTTNEYKALEWVRKWEQGLVIGSGLKYYRTSFEIRYEKGNGMSGYDGLTSKTNRLSFLLGYCF